MYPDICKVLELAGFKRVNSDQTEARPVYVETDDQGRRVRGVRFVVDKLTNTCISPYEDMRCYDVPTLIVENAHRFTDNPKMLTNPEEVAYKVCNKLSEAPKLFMSNGELHLEGYRTKYDKPVKYPLEMTEYLKSVKDPKDLTTGNYQLLPRDARNHTKMLTSIIDEWKRDPAISVTGADEIAELKQGVTDVINSCLLKSKDYNIILLKNKQECKMMDAYGTEESSARLKEEPAEEIEETEIVHSGFRR